MGSKKLTTWVIATFSFIVFFCLLVDGSKTEARMSSERIEDVLIGIHLSSQKYIQIEPEKSTKEDLNKNKTDKIAIIRDPIPQGSSTCYKHTAGEDQNQYVRIAAQISNNNINFLALLDAENGLWTPERKHGVNSNGSSDWGFCGTNDKWHSKIVNDERFFLDPRWQLEQCYRLYKGGTIFYGKSRTHITRKNFICP